MPELRSSAAGGFARQHHRLSGRFSRLFGSGSNQVDTVRPADVVS